jgi:hypothetical protein
MGYTTRHLSCATRRICTIYGVPCREGVVWNLIGNARGVVWSDPGVWAGLKKAYSASEYALEDGLKVCLRSPCKIHTVC